MNLRLELRYAVLISLLMLLWLALEFMVGLQDTYVAYHPFVTVFALLIPLIGSYRALRSKREELNGQLTFGQGLKTGLWIAVFSALFSVPVQLVFHFVINPDFFDTMIAHAVQQAELHKLDTAQAATQAQSFFCLQSYIPMSFIVTLILGIVFAAIMALVMRNKK